MSDVTIEMTGEQLADLLDQTLLNMENVEEEALEEMKNHVKAFLWDLAATGVIQLALRRLDAEETLQKLIGVDPLQ